MVQYDINTEQGTVVTKGETHLRHVTLNALIPERCGSNFEIAIFKYMLWF